MRSMHMLSLTTARAFNIPEHLICHSLSSSVIAPRLQTNSNFTFRKNQICAGHAAGIAITEDGRGHISYNEISNMEWAGIDVRYGGNPVISHNQIVKGHSDGVVVGSGGKSVIFDNDLIGRGPFYWWAEFCRVTSHPVVILTSACIGRGGQTLAFTELNICDKLFE